MRENFVCPSCDKKHFILTYTYDGTNYKLKKSKQQITCDCPAKTILLYIDKPFNGIPTYGKIASMTPQERSKVLKKRAKLDFKKNIADRKREADKNFMNDIKNLKK